MRRQTLSAINQKYDHIGFGNRLLGLLRHLMQDAILGDWFKATGVDHEKGMRTYPALAIVTIACQSRQVGHQRIAAPCEAIEQG
jgi:hypothetical protein